MRDYIKSWKILKETFSHYKRSLVVLLVFGVVSAILDGLGINIIIPVISFLSGDTGFVPTDTISKVLKTVFDFLHIPFTFKFLLISMGVLFLARAVVLTLFTYVRARIGADFLYKESNHLFSGILRAKWPFLSNLGSGFLQNTIFYDVKQSSTLLDVLAQFLQSSTGFVIYSLVALSISPLIVFITLSIGVILMLTLQPLVKKTALVGEEKSKSEKILSGYLIENISGLKVIKASGVGKKVAESGQLMLEKLRNVYTRSAVVSNLGPTIMQPFSFIFVIILLALAYKLPSFNIATFAASLYLIQKIFTYIQSTQATIHSIADLTPYASGILRFKTMLNEQNEEVLTANRKYIFNDKLTFDNISLSYQPEIPVLAGVSFSISKGKFIGIIGPSGVGKTSVADLILRLLHPNKGSIRLDNVPIKDITLEDWQKNVSFVSQDIFLINRSVNDNIKFYDSSISDEEVRHAAKRAHIYNEIMRLEYGFDTVIGNSGVTLSFGQRQRIVLARALVRSPSLLILDEATSSLDSESEALVKETIEELRKSITLIVIAHRISTVIEADSVFILKDGTIVEEGKPKDMLNNPESYLSRMAKLQNIT